MTVIRIGTSGFSYKDWIEPVYPPDLPERDWLGFYVREFSTVGLNVTFYRIPSKRTVAGWLEKTPDDFLFSVKAFQGLTHEREEPDFAVFVSSLHPLVEAGKFGCVLAQFPLQQPLSRAGRARRAEPAPIAHAGRDSGAAGQGCCRRQMPTLCESPAAQ
jgi:uncharacterized protein YecE (DUF72 family)